MIDTPGVLDRPIEERNTVEMQSITANPNPNLNPKPKPKPKPNPSP